MKYGSRIISTGLGTPSLKYTNDDLSKIVETNDEWIRTRTGIRERRFIDFEKGETITDLCVRAAEQALERANLKASDIDLVLTGTISAETFMPNNSARVIGRLGMKEIAALI
jgi:3-oxoacyl-[acyl-carrier-protein] synthase-3